MTVLFIPGLPDDREMCLGTWENFKHVCVLALDHDGDHRCHCVVPLDALSVEPQETPLQAASRIVTEQQDQEVE